MAEAGLGALWIGAALCLLQLALAAQAVPWLRRADADTTAPGQRAAEHARLMRPLALAQAAATALAFLLLIGCFVRVDLSVALVAVNDSVEKSLLYRVAATWGNHEGSMLMWVTILGVAGAAVAWGERRLSAATLAATLGAQAAIGLGFYAFLLFASNPFARLFPVPIMGRGLNPLLQDPGLAFHPPTLYLGYVGLSVAFSFAVGALVTDEVGPAFARAMRPWVLGAWSLLTLGITAGSYWAYYELGWGGWWVWDPVENASLMPWLAATALLHSVSVLATRDGLRAWTLMLAVVAFSMSMVGTFLVRSGILTSVHAFAVDPRRGSFLLALLCLYIGGALALFGWRVGRVREGARFVMVSREGALVLNNLLLTAVLGIVLLGTLYPLLVEALGGRLSVGPPYFNAAAGPLALLLVAVMGAGPLMRWRHQAWAPLLRRIAPAAGVTLLALVGVRLLHPAIGWLPLLGLALAAGVAMASAAPLIGRNLLRTPMHLWGMVVAHLGITVALAGMACDSAFTVERLAAVRVGEALPVGPWTVRLAAVSPTFGDGWEAMEATLTARRGGGDQLTLQPQARSYWAPPTNTSETAIHTGLDGQLYTVLGRQGEDGRWQLRLWWKPFVTLIWGGGAMVAVGGLLSLAGRVRRERRQGAWAA
jgi:cytochrome c-type biogenesis protein CcmF